MCLQLSGFFSRVCLRAHGCTYSYTDFSHGCAYVLTGVPSAIQNFLTGVPTCSRVCLAGALAGTIGSEMSASGVDDWEEPPAELEPPEAGWPWQLALCRVFECQQTGYSRSFKIQCTKCGWAPAGFTQAARVQTHFGRVLTGGKPGGANKCGVSKDILLEQARIYG